MSEQRELYLPTDEPTTGIARLKNQVEYVLRNFPDTRNSDRLLTWTVWQVFYKVLDQISKEQFLQLPNPANIQRVRARFQNDLYLYLPTTEAVARSRRLNIDRWRQVLGYSTGSMPASNPPDIAEGGK